MPHSLMKRQGGRVAPPPPPLAPPPPPGLCALSASSCTDLKVLNLTVCECQCVQFLPAMECPTPRHMHTPRRSHTHTHSHTHSHSRTYEYVIDENGCRELTPKGNHFRRQRRRNPRRTRKTKESGTGKTKKTRKSKTDRSKSEPPATIQTPADSCPTGQTPNFDTCECSRQAS